MSLPPTSAINWILTPRKGRVTKAAIERKYPPRELRDDEYDARFNRNRKDIFYAIRDELPPPTAIPTPQNRRNMDLWCEYHKEHGHTLPNCRELKRILDQYADEEKLNRFLHCSSSERRYNP